LIREGMAPELARAEVLGGDTGESQTQPVKLPRGCRVRDRETNEEVDDRDTDRTGGSEPRWMHTEAGSERIADPTDPYTEDHDVDHASALVAVQRGER
jgi:hypothetical protein